MQDALGRTLMRGDWICYVGGRRGFKIGRVVYSDGDYLMLQTFSKDFGEWAIGMKGGTKTLRHSDYLVLVDESAIPAEVKRTAEIFLPIDGTTAIGDAPRLENEQSI